MPLFETFTSKHVPKVRLSKMRSIPTTEDLKYALAEAKKHQKPVELPFKNPFNGADFVIQVTLGLGVAPPRWVFEREDASGPVQLWTRDTLEVIMIQGKIKVESMYAPGTEPQTNSGQNLPAIDQAALQEVSHPHLTTVVPEAHSPHQNTAPEQFQSGSRQSVGPSFIGPQRPNFGVKEKAPSPFDEDFDAVPVNNWLGTPRAPGAGAAGASPAGGQTSSQELPVVSTDTLTGTTSWSAGSATGIPASEQAGRSSGSFPAVSGANQSGSFPAVGSVAQPGAAHSGGADSGGADSGDHLSGDIRTGELQSGAIQAGAFSTVGGSPHCAPPGPGSETSRVPGVDLWAADQDVWNSTPADPLNSTGPTLAKPENIDRSEIGKVFQSLTNEDGLYTPEAFKFLLTIWCEHAQALDQPLSVIIFELSRKDGKELVTVPAASVRKVLNSVLKPFDVVSSLKEHEFALILYGADSIAARKFSQVLENAFCDSKAAQYPELVDASYHCGVSIVTRSVRDPGIAITTAREAKEMARKSRMSVFVFS